MVQPAIIDAYDATLFESAGEPALVESATVGVAIITVILVIMIALIITFCAITVIIIPAPLAIFNNDIAGDAIAEPRPLYVPYLSYFGAAISVGPAFNAINALVDGGAAASAAIVIIITSPIITIIVASMIVVFFAGRQQSSQTANHNGAGNNFASTYAIAMTVVSFPCLSGHRDTDQSCCSSPGAKQAFG